MDVYSNEESKHRLKSLQSWSQKGKRFIYKRYVFTDFVKAFDFMTQVSYYAEEINHHPDWRNVYKVVEVELTTHSSNGLTELDFLLAKKMDEIADSIL